MESGKAVSYEAGTLVGDGGESPARMSGEDVNSLRNELLVGQIDNRKTKSPYNKLQLKVISTKSI
jgi:hypothetical protein